MSHESGDCEFLDLTKPTNEFHEYDAFDPLKEETKFEVDVEPIFNTTGIKEHTSLSPSQFHPIVLDSTKRSNSRFSIKRCFKHTENSKSTTQISKDSRLTIKSDRALSDISVEVVINSSSEENIFNTCKSRPRITVVRRATLTQKPNGLDELLKI